MKRNDMLKIINPVLGLLVVNQILTGLLGDSLPLQAFDILHKGGGYALAGVAAIHLFLNWNWVKTNYFKRHAAPATK